MHSKEIKRAFIEKRRQGFAVTELTKEYNISISTAAKWLKEANVYMGQTNRSKELSLKGAMNNPAKYLPRTDIQISKTINTKYGDKFVLVKYESGTKNKEKGISDGYIFLYCNDCGCVLKKTAQVLKPSWKKQIHCDNCRKISREYKEYQIKERQSIKQEQRKMIEKTKAEKYIESHKHICKECGIEYVSRRTSYCSNECFKKAQNRLCSRKKDKRFENPSHITWKQIVKRTKTMNCSICGILCDVDDYYVNANGIIICGGKYPSVDHIIPCAKGGTDTWDNVQLACRECNSLKGDRSGFKMVCNQLAMNI